MRQLPDLAATSLLVVVVVVVVVAAASRSARAGEGRGSTYLQGTYGDFQTGVFGPPGVYCRSDLFRWTADFGPGPPAGGVEVGAWVDLTKLVVLTDLRFLGARYGAAAALPVIIEVDVSASAPGGEGGVMRDRSFGRGDAYLAPLLLNWELRHHHVTFSPLVVIPTGQYDVERLFNIGRNYWSFDLGGSYTWLDDRRGHELSLTTGVLLNARNPTTQYRTGDEFHLDALLAQYVSAHVGVGAVGYYFHQFQDDDGAIVGPIDDKVLRARGGGVGPAAIYTTTVGSVSLTFIAKALFDVAGRNRFQGNWYGVGVVLGLPAPTR